MLADKFADISFHLLKSIHQKNKNLENHQNQSNPGQEKNRCIFANS